MRILIVYDTGSVNRNTEKVAKAMSEILHEKGFDVDCLNVKDVDPASMKSYDCVLAGSPTQWHKATTYCAISGQVCQRRVHWKTCRGI